MVYQLFMRTNWSLEPILGTAEKVINVSTLCRYIGFNGGSIHTVGYVCCIFSQYICSDISTLCGYIGFSDDIYTLSDGYVLSRYIGI